MAIASLGTLGTGASAASGTTLAFNTATTALASGDFAILTVVGDNLSTADGDNNEHSAVSGGTGTWTKLGEHCNSNGAAGAGVTVSVWLFEATATLSVGTTITATFSSAITAKCSSMWGYSKGAGNSIRKDPDAATNPVTSDQDASANFGSRSFSSLPSQERLYFRGLGKETNSIGALTPTTNFSAITGTRSSSASTAVIVRGEFRINTSTGETSNPSHGAATDSVGLFLALEEYSPSVSGAASGTLDATGAATGTVSIVGAGADALALTGAATGTVSNGGVSGVGAGALDVTGASTATVLVSGVASGGLSASGGATGAVLDQGQASGSLSFDGVSSGTASNAGANASASGLLDFAGSASAIAQSPVQIIRGDDAPGGWKRRFYDREVEEFEEALAAIEGADDPQDAAQDATEAFEPVETAASAVREASQAISEGLRLLRMQTLKRKELQAEIAAVREELALIAAWRRKKRNNEAALLLLM